MEETHPTVKRWRRQAQRCFWAWPWGHSWERTPWYFQRPRLAFETCRSCGKCRQREITERR